MTHPQSDCRASTPSCFGVSSYCTNVQTPFQENIEMAKVLSIYQKLTARSEVHTCLPNALCLDMSNDEKAPVGATECGVCVYIISPIQSSKYIPQEKGKYKNRENAFFLFSIRWKCSHLVWQFITICQKYTCRNQVQTGPYSLVTSKL